MKAFSPAGMAVKAYYGGPGWPQGGSAGAGGRGGWVAPKTLGNPDGALAGGGAYAAGGKNPNGPNQGGGGSAGLVWTFRGTPLLPGSSHVQAANGVVISANPHGFWRSTDDGQTWTLVDSSTGAGNQITYAGGNVWGIVCNPGLGNPNFIMRSTDNGLTWGAPILLPAALLVPGSLASNLAGVWVCGGGFGTGHSVNFLARSTDDGLTWAMPGTLTGTFFRIIWTGTQFAASYRGGPFGNDPAVSNSADGITWTNIVLVTADSYAFGMNFDPASGLYTIAAGSSNALRIANSVAGLATAADKSTGLPGGVFSCVNGNNVIFAFDDQGNVADSLDGGATFQRGTLNYTAGAIANDETYQPGTKVFIAVGDAGNVATRDTGATKILNAFGFGGIGSTGPSFNGPGQTFDSAATSSAGTPSGFSGTGLSPDPLSINGAVLSTFGMISTSPVNIPPNGLAFIVILATPGLPQNHFTSVSFTLGNGDSYTLTTASAQFNTPWDDTATTSGWTTWIWPNSVEPFFPPPQFSNPITFTL